MDEQILLFKKCIPNIIDLPFVVPIKLILSCHTLEKLFKACASLSASSLEQKELDRAYIFYDTKIYPYLIMHLHSQ